MITLKITTYKEPGWLNDYKDGYVRSFMNLTDIEILESSLSKNRIKYVKDDLLIIEDSYDNKITALRTLAKIQKLQNNMNDIRFKVTVDVIEKL